MLEDLNKEDLEVAGGLRRLFRQRYILKNKNLQWFQKIVDHRTKLQNVLDSFLLKLIVDEQLGVAYLNELDDELEDKLSYSIGRKKRLSSFTSLLLLNLRHERLQFYLSPEENIKPLIKQNQLREYLKSFDSNEIDARFEKAFQKSIKELKELQVLLEAEQNSEIYEISAVCDIMLPLDDIKIFENQLDNYFSKNKKGLYDDL